MDHLVLFLIVPTTRLAIDVATAQEPTNTSTFPNPNFPKRPPKESDSPCSRSKPDSIGPTIAAMPLISAKQVNVIRACSGYRPAESAAAAGHTDEKPPLKPPNMMAKANTCAKVFANPQSKKAEMALPTALTNIIHGYGKRSLRKPTKIWPTTPEELKRERTMVAERGDEMEVVNIAI